MATFVGLDIGTRTITGAVFAGNAKKFRMTDFFTREIPEPGQDPFAEGGQTPAGELVVPPSIQEMVQALIAERGLQKADVVACVDAKDAIIREIIVPFTKDEHIRKVIGSEVEEHFQTFDVDDVQLEFLKVEEMAERSRILIAAVKNRAVQDRLDVLKGGGVDPVSLDLDVAALYNAFALTPAFDPSRTVLLLDMGATATKVILVEKGQLRKVRSIRMISRLSPSRLLAEPVGAVAGGSAGEIPFSDSYSIEARFAEIENALRRLDPLGSEEEGKGAADDEPIAILSDEEFDRVHGGVLGAAAALGAPPENGNGIPGALPPPELDYGDYLQRLGIEIQRTFAASFLQAGVDLICMTGGLAQRPEAVRFFEEEFDVETIHLDFGDRFPMDVPAQTQTEASRVGAVAVGLALKGLGQDRIGFEYRKGRFRFERKFERMKYPMLVLGILTFFLFLHGAIILLNKNKILNQSIGAIQENERTVFQKFFDKPNTSDLLYPQVLNQKKVWEQQLGVGGANIATFVPVFKALGEISQAVKDTAGQAKVLSIDLNLRTSQTSGKTRCDSSTLVITTTDGALGSRLEKLFSRPDQIFSASPSEQKEPSGSIKLTVTLLPQQRYLDRLKAKN